MQRETRVRLWERLIKRRADSGPPLDQKMGRPGRPIQVRPLPRGLPGLLGYECLNGPQMLYRSNKAYTYIGPLYEAHNDYLLFVRLSQLERERTRIDGSAAHLLPQEKKKPSGLTAHLLPASVLAACVVGESSCGIYSFPPRSSLPPAVSSPLAGRERRVKVGSFHCQIRERLVCNQLYV